VTNREADIRLAYRGGHEFLLRHRVEDRHYTNYLGAIVNYFLHWTMEEVRHSAAGDIAFSAARSALCDALLFGRGEAGGLVVVLPEGLVIGTNLYDLAMDVWRGRASASVIFDAFGDEEARGRVSAYAEIVRGAISVRN